MSTRGQLLDDVVDILGTTGDTVFRAFMVRRFNSTLRRFWNLHDWEFKHKVGTFNTVAGTEVYDLSTTAVVGVGNDNVRSANDLEIVYDKTNGVTLTKVNMSEIRRAAPREDDSGKPRWYAPWGQYKIYLKSKPNSVCVINFLYTSIPNIPTGVSDLDANDMLTTYGLPYHMEPYFEKYLLAEGMLKVDESRRDNMLMEIEKIWKKEAIQTDMEHMDSNARFMFWSDVMGNNGTFDDYLRSSFYSNNDY